MMAMSDTSMINLTLCTLAYFALTFSDGCMVVPFLEGSHHIQAPINGLLVYEICPQQGGTPCYPSKNLMKPRQEQISNCINLINDT